MNLPTSFPLLHQQIAKAIVRSPHLDSRKIKVRTNRGRVILCGSTESFFEKQMAQEALRGIEGITSIENELEVEWEDGNQ
jgi:osmotically-inducible protein OsmY